MRLIILFPLLSAPLSCAFAFTPANLLLSHSNFSNLRRQREQLLLPQYNNADIKLSQLYAKKFDIDDDNVENNDSKNLNDYDSIDSIRQKLEVVCSTSHSITDNMTDETVQFVLTPQYLQCLSKSKESSPLLTSIARLRRESEIQILAKSHEETKLATTLQNLMSQYSEEDHYSSDNMNYNRIHDSLLERLQNSWNLERGSNAAKELEIINKYLQRYHNGDESNDISNNSLLKLAEDRLHALINDHDPFWVEPLHRLSMVYYLQGRLEEAQQFEEWVLSVKPWHIPALSNLVRIAEAQKNAPLAIQWASRRLPNVYSNGGHRRIAWFQGALQQARTMLAEDEERTQRRRDIMLLSLNNNNLFNNKSLNDDKQQQRNSRFEKNDKDLSWQ